QRLAGGRSLLDAALTLQQERIRNTADEAFAESLARFHDNLGTVEQLLHESAQKITSQNLTELEGRAVDVRHHTVEEMHKSAEWYEKKVQTQIAGLTERAVEHAGNQLRETAGASFAQTQASRAEVAQQTTAEQEEFLQRFRGALSGALESGIGEAREKVQEGFAPLLESWKQMAEAHEAEMLKQHMELSNHAAEQYRNRLENVSNSWMVATVTTLDKHARDVMANIGAEAETKIRETCSQVFESLGET